MTDIRQVTVPGTGVHGSQIASQTAFSGVQVVAYDINDEALEKARSRFDGLVSTYVADQVAGAFLSPCFPLRREMHSDGR